MKSMLSNMRNQLPTFDNLRLSNLTDMSTPTYLHIVLISYLTFRIFDVVLYVKTHFHYLLLFLHVWNQNLPIIYLFFILFYSFGFFLGVVFLLEWVCGDFVFCYNWIGLLIWFVSLQISKGLGPFISWALITRPRQWTRGWNP